MKTLIYKTKHMNMKTIFLFTAIAAFVFFAGCAKKAEVKDAGHAKEYYTCSMHPQVISDKPGECPICGMELIKKTSVSSESAGENSAADMQNMVALSGKKQVLANVTTVKISKQALQKEVTSYSYLDFAEQNRTTISARFSGRIEKLYVNSTGAVVRKGQPLFEIYSPQLVQAQNDFLLAFDNGKKAAGQNSLVSASRKRLEIFGMTKEQLAALEASREVKLTFTYYAATNGTVIEKKVQEGAYVSEGTPLFEIADLGMLWNISEVYENDLATIHTGDHVKIHVRAYPGKEFNGKVTFIYPVVNGQSRTIKVRSEIVNGGNLLKPQMYGETIHSASSGYGLTIPSGAVINTGKRTVVWVKTSDGMFEARDVQIGGKFKDAYQVLSGLQEGDEVAVTGGFLIDSESQLETGMPAGHEGMDMPKHEPATNKNSNEHKNH